MAAQLVDHDGVRAVAVRNLARPRGQVARERPIVGIGEQQRALADDLQAQPRLDVGREPLRSLAREHVREVLRVGVQDLLAPREDADVPRVPQQHGEGDQRRQPQQQVAERPGDRRGADPPTHCR
jgi:hypothetical protein